MTDEQHPSLSLLAHGGSKVGKTRLTLTMPGRKLLLDAEGGTRFLPGRRIEWDPHKYAPPVDDGSWDFCVVYIRRYETLTIVYAWLSSGQHPFDSVSIDSISEAQQRCVDDLVGVNAMRTQDWGELLRKMSGLVRQFRDLTFHPTRPLQAVVIVAMSRQVDGKWVPYVQGQLATTLPFYIDVIGYYYVQAVDDPQTGHQTVERRMLVSPHPQYEAGDRTDQLSPVLLQPNVTDMIDQIYHRQPQAAA